MLITLGGCRDDDTPSDTFGFTDQTENDDSCRIEKSKDRLWRPTCIVLAFSYL